MSKKLIFFLFTFMFLKYAEPDKNVSRTPIVFWHGMGDSCCAGIGKLMNYIKEELPGVYTLSLKIGTTAHDQEHNSFFLHPNTQVEIACDIVSSDPQLRDGFHAIGFSQGAQFLRALVQRCEGAKVKNLISLGGQHQGVYGIPTCPTFLFLICDVMKLAINFGGYWSFLQEQFVQLTFWHNPLNEKAYIEQSTFLADINNERAVNTEYVDRLKKLENFVMVRYENDTMVIPVESSWFGFYEPGKTNKLLALNESRIYVDDRLGLREMDQQQKLHFVLFPGEHLQSNWDLFKQTIIEIFLSTS